MRIAIVGTGALACVFAARLSEHSRVTMLGTWDAGRTALEEYGVRIFQPNGRFRRVRVNVAASPAGLKPFDFTLVLVKSYQTERAAAWAAGLLPSDGMAVTLQNGLDNLSRLVASVGEERAAAGVTYNGATMIGPGMVRHSALQPTYLGAGPLTDARLRHLASELQRAGLETHVDDQIEGRLWGKAVANAAINPLTALWRVPNGALIANEERRKLLACLAREAAGVARARGTSLPFADEVAYVEGVCKATAGNRSSMLQDVERGRRTEIDSITGVILSEARRVGLPAPVTEQVWRLVRAI